MRSRNLISQVTIFCIFWMAFWACTGRSLTPPFVAPPADAIWSTSSRRRLTQALWLWLASPALERWQQWVSQSMSQSGSPWLSAAASSLTSLQQCHARNEVATPLLAASAFRQKSFFPDLLGTANDLSRSVWLWIQERCNTYVHFFQQGAGCSFAKWRDDVSKVTFTCRGGSARKAQSPGQALDQLRIVCSLLAPYSSQPCFEVWCFFIICNSISLHAKTQVVNLTSLKHCHCHCHCHSIHVNSMDHGTFNWQTAPYNNKCMWDQPT